MPATSRCGARFGIGRGQPAPSGLEPGLLAAIRNAVALELGERDPERVLLTLSWIQTGQKSRLAALRAEAGNASLELFLKQLVMVAEPISNAHDQRRTGRPHLAVPGAFGERFRREYASLRAVEDALERTPVSGLRPIHPIAYLEDYRALVMERFPGTSLRRSLRASLGRVRPPGAVSTDGRAVRAAVQHAGVWLRTFHEYDATPSDGRWLGGPTRHATVSELAVAARELCTYLAEHVGPSAYFDSLCRELRARMGATLPARLPLGRMHGDFAPRNVLVAEDGAVAVLDIDGWTRGPVYEDIAYFGVNLRTSLPVAIAQGLTQDRHARDLVDRTFVEAYFESEAPPWETLHVFDVLVMLDKWCGRPPRPPRLPGGRAISMIARTLVDRFFRAEIERILAER